MKMVRIYQVASKPEPIFAQGLQSQPIEHEVRPQRPSPWNTNFPH